MAGYVKPDGETVGRRGVGGFTDPLSVAVPIGFLPIDTKPCFKLLVSGNVEDITNRW
jgi:hypothetical protein